MRIPVNEPLIGEEELRNVADCIKSGWISSKGGYINTFEEEFSRYCGCKYGVTTTSGTTALHLAVASLGLKGGDEVILPTFTMIASAYAIIYSGARPVLVDSEPRTWNIDPKKIEEKITKRTKAIMPVHIYGHPCDMDPILEIARDHGLFVIEDCAEAHGAEYKGKRVGMLGDVGCFSFYANKIITTGEGGMLVTNSKEIYEKASLLKDLAHSKRQRFLHEELAYNYRMTNMQAAVGLAQLRKIDRHLGIKKRMAALYGKLLADTGGLTLPVEEPWATNVYWMYSILVDRKEFGLPADGLMKRLAEKGIDTRSFFIPMHRQPVFRNLGLDTKGSYPVSERLSQQGLYLPSGLAITEEQISAVCEAVREIRGSL